MRCSQCVILIFIYSALTFDQDDEDGEDDGDFSSLDDLEGVQGL